MSLVLTRGEKEGGNACSAAAALLPLHGAVEEALEPLEERALRARDGEPEVLAVLLERGERQRVDAAREPRRLRSAVSLGSNRSRRDRKPFRAAAIQAETVSLVHCGQLSLS